MNRLYFNYKHVLIYTFFLFVLHSPAFSQTEEITITTYYPSPYGSYEELEADRFMIGAGTLPADDGVVNFQMLGADPGASGNEGSIYYNSTDNEFKYHDGIDWQPLADVPCMRRNYIANSGVNPCPTGYAFAGAVYAATEHITYFDNPLPDSGMYLCCQYCDDFNNDEICD